MVKPASPTFSRQPLWEGEVSRILLGIASHHAKGKSAVVLFQLEDSGVRSLLQNNTFEYADNKSLIAAQDCFLKIGESMLEGAKTLRGRDQLVCLLYLSAVIRRLEFLPENFLSHFQLFKQQQQDNIQQHQQMHHSHSHNSNLNSKTGALPNTPTQSKQFLSPSISSTSVSSIPSSSSNTSIASSSSASSSVPPFSPAPDFKNALSALQTQKTPASKKPAGVLVKPDDTRRAFAYKQLLWQSLLFALEKVCIQENRRILQFLLFAAEMLAISYFRVPSVSDMFRKMSKMIAVDEHVHEYFFNPSAMPTLGNAKICEVTGEERGKAVLAFRERAHRFILFSETLDQPDCFADLVSFLSVTKETPWLIDLCKSYSFLFSLYEELAEQAIGLCGGDANQVLWSSMPIYPSLVVQSFQTHFRTPLIKLQPRWIEEMTTFARDSALIYPIVWLVFSKTNLFDSASVVKGFDIVISVFQTASEAGVKGGVSFPILAFQEIFDRIFDFPHLDATLRALQMLYHFLDIIDNNLRSAFFFDYLLKKHFIHFFLHWNREVRLTFHRICVYKLVRITKKFVGKPKKGRRGSVTSVENVDDSADSFDPLDEPLATSAVGASLVDFPAANSDITGISTVIARNPSDDSMPCTPSPASPSDSPFAVENSKEEKRSKHISLKNGFMSLFKQNKNAKPPSGAAPAVEEAPPAKDAKLRNSSAVVPTHNSHQHHHASADTEVALAAKIFPAVCRRFMIDMDMARKSGFVIDQSQMLLATSKSNPQLQMSRARKASVMLGHRRSCSMSEFDTDAGHGSEATEDTQIQDKLQQMSMDVEAPQRPAMQMLDSKSFRERLSEIRRRALTGVARPVKGNTVPVAMSDDPYYVAAQNLIKEVQDRIVREGATLGLVNRSADLVIKSAFEHYVAAARAVCRGGHSYLIPADRELFCIHALMDLEIVFLEYNAWLQHSLTTDSPTIVYPDLRTPSVRGEGRVD